MNQEKETIQERAIRHTVHKRKMIRQVELKNRASKRRTRNRMAKTSRLVNRLSK